MNQDILAILQQKESGFSKGQRRIAKYITDLMFDEFDPNNFPWPTIVD